MQLNSKMLIHILLTIEF